VHSWTRRSFPHWYFAFGSALLWGVIEIVALWRSRRLGRLNAKA
jgi:hypothetical protein